MWLHLKNRTVDFHLETIIFIRTAFCDSMLSSENRRVENKQTKKKKRNGKRNKQTKLSTHFNCVNSKFWLHLSVFFHDHGGQFQNRVFVAPSNQPTFLVNFTFVCNFLSINVHQMRSEISLIWRWSLISVANGFVCSTCIKVVFCLMLDRLT